MRGKRRVRWRSNTATRTIPAQKFISRELGYPPSAGNRSDPRAELYNDPQGHQKLYRGAHIAVGAAITGFFVAQTATGVWNLVDSWKDPNHKKLRRLHSIMMLGADAGFVAAYGTAPGGENLVTFDRNKRTHRTIVFTSMGVATASYLLMLFGNK